MPQSEQAEPKRNFLNLSLLQLSGPSVELYRQAHRVCSLERKPNPKTMQQPATDLKGSSRVGMEMKFGKCSASVRSEKAFVR